MKQYRFKQEALEIREPSLPQPWIHYLSNGQLLEIPFLSWDWLRGREQVEVEVTLGGNK